MSTTINPIIIFGAGSLGRVALDIFKANSVVVYGFLDEDESLYGQELDFVGILGNPRDDGYLKLIGKKCDAFVASDDNDYRKEIIDMLNKRRKVMPINAFHPSVSIASGSALGHGNLLSAKVSIGANTTIQNHCIINSGAIIEHQVNIADFVQIGAGSILNSGVEIAEDAFVGSGVTIVSGVKIGKHARVGAGSVVVSDVEDNTTVFGNPAKLINP